MARQLIPTFVYLLVGLWSPTIRAQKYKVYIDSVLVAEANDKAELNEIETGLLMANWEGGYLFSQISSRTDSSTSIYKGEVHPFAIRRVYESNSWDTTYLPRKKPYDYLNDLINFWPDHGYPFATLQVQKIHQVPGGYEADLVLEKGPFIEYDTLKLVGKKVSTNRRYLEKMLEVERGEGFVESDYQNINRRMSRLPYHSLNGPPDVSFENGKATVYLDLEEQSSNSFEGVAGLLPGGSSKDFLVTGYIDLQLNNLFNSGKAFSFVWNRFAQQSQSMDLGYSHPFFLDTRLLLDIDFSLLKQDTSFINQDFELAMGSYVGRTGTLRANYTSSSGKLISTDQEWVSRANLVDYKTDIYGLSADFSNYALPFGFGTGFKSRSSASIGQKKIMRNPNLDSKFYDSLSLKSTMAVFEGGIKYQFLLAGQLGLFHQVEGGMILNEQIINNEMYRLGGLRSLRGFNENFYFAQEFTLSRLEVRQYFERQSFFMLFYDQLYYRDRDKRDFPFGVGLGFALSSNNSLFNFALAVGRSDDLPLDLAATKIHFGYISKF